LIQPPELRSLFFVRKQAMNEEYATFFDSLTSNDILPLDEITPPILNTISSTSLVTILPTTKPNVSSVVLQSQAINTQKAMDRAVNSFTCYNLINHGIINEDNVLKWLSSISSKYAPTSL
jgi:hypothetical protein